MINCCRSMPVESVYSRLGSEGNTSRNNVLGDNKNKNIKSHTVIFNTSGEPHLNIGKESSFITFYLLFSGLAFMRNPSHTHTHLWTMIVSLDLCSSPALPLCATFSRYCGNLMRCLCLETPARQENEGSFERGDDDWTEEAVADVCVCVLPGIFLRTVRSPRRQQHCAPIFLWPETHTPANKQY